MVVVKEACIETLEQALNAEKKGADQLELCADLDEDGLTPPQDLVEDVLDSVSIPVKVMIRNRPGDFYHGAEDIEAMCKSIRELSNLDVDHFVLGSLTENDEIYLSAIQRMVNCNPGATYTFHKAIDYTEDPIKAIRRLKTVPQIQFILSSGQAETAFDGADMLKSMNTECQPDIKLIAAGKITDQNLDEVRSKIGIRHYHGKLIVGQL